MNLKRHGPGPVARIAIPLAVATLAVALVALVGPAHAARPADAAAATSVGTPVALARDVHFLPGRYLPNTQPDGNSVLFRGPQGFVVVDTGRHPEHTQAVLDFARAAGTPVAAIVNTHWHLDHVGGNPMVRRAHPGVRVYASAAIDGALTGFLADYRAQLLKMIDKTADAEARKPWRAEVALIDNGAALAPDVRIAEARELTLAGRPLRIGLQSRAVTAGDVWVFDPKTRVLAAGDLVTLPAPFLDTACPSGWQKALGDLAAVDFTTLVPGHGAPLTRRDFACYRAAFDALLVCAASSRTRDECVLGWTQDAAALLRSEDPAFVRSLLGYYVDLLRGDPARLARLCAG